MSVQARSLMVATSIVAAMSRRVGLPLPTLPRKRGRVGRGSDWPTRLDIAATMLVATIRDLAGTDI